MRALRKQLKAVHAKGFKGCIRMRRVLIRR